MLDGSFFNNCLSLFYEREKHSILDLDLNISILDLNIISKKVLKLISQKFSTYEYGLYQGRELNQHSLSLHKMCPYSEIFWSVFSRIRTEYGEIRSTSPYSVWRRENTHQKKLPIWHFSRNDYKTGNCYSNWFFKTTFFM